MNLLISKLRNMKEILNVWGSLSSILSLIGLGWLIWWLKMTWEFLWVDTTIQFIYIIAIIVLFSILIVSRYIKSTKHVKQCENNLKKRKQCVEKHKK